MKKAGQGDHLDDTYFSPFTANSNNQKVASQEIDMTRNIIPVVPCELASDYVPRTSSIMDYMEGNLRDTNRLYVIDIRRHHPPIRLHI